MPVRVVVDHLSGARRGRRQEFTNPVELRFGRHPQCEVAFDVHSDIEASSQHAKLTFLDEKAVLRDVGSSNGTFVGGDLVGEITLKKNTLEHIRFGQHGPEVGLWIGDLESEPPPMPPLSWRWRRIKRIEFAILAMAIVAIATGYLLYR